VKNCPLLKEEQEQEQFRKQGRKQFGNSSAKRFSKAMFVAWGDTTEDDEASEEEEAFAALMARSKSDSDDEPLDSLAQLKEQVSGFNKSVYIRGVRRSRTGPDRTGLDRGPKNWDVMDRGPNWSYLSPDRDRTETGPVRLPWFWAFFFYFLCNLFCNTYKFAIERPNEWA